MEDQLQQRNINGVWKSLKTISGQRKPDSCAPGNQTWVYDLNLFFNRFDQDYGRRIMFFGFSSAFNTIQPALLGDKLELMGVDQHLTSWILDYLTDQPHDVRTQDCVPDMVVCSMGGAPDFFL